MTTFLLCWIGLSFLLAIPVGRFCATNVYDDAPASEPPQ